MVEADFAIPTNITRQLAGEIRSQYRELSLYQLIYIFSLQSLEI